MIRAPIRKIIHHSVVDGPGNRTVVFLQGCNLRCLYCHNPETQPLEAEGEVCMLTAEEVWEEIKVDLPLIRGITVSGGECTLYPDFLTELFGLCKKVHLTCLLDSNGTLDFSLYSELMDLTAGVLLDVKAWEPEIHQNVTAGSNRLVKKNLVFLAKQGKLAELRHVVLPGIIDSEAVLKGVAETLGAATPETSLQLIRFRSHGVKGPLSQIASPSLELLKELRDQALQLGFTMVRIT